jgi:hypothetical protein
LPLRSRKILVTRAQSQAVGLAHGRNPLDPDGKAEISHQPADQNALLVVLFPEKGDIRMHCEKEAQDDPGHPVKMTRPEGSTKQVGQARNLDPNRFRGSEGVKILDIRRIGQVNPQSFKALEITFQSSRVADEIFSGTELSGIHEHAHDRAIGQ